MERKCLLVFAICFLINFPLIAQLNLYVSPSGAGNNFSAASPGSLEQLNDKIVALKQAKSGAIHVILKGGTYTIKHTLALSWQAAANDTAAVVIAGAPGEKAVLSGGIEIKNWSPAGKGIYKARVPGNFRFRQLYVNGKPAIRARYPNRDNEDDFGPYNRVLRFDVQRQKIGVAASDIPAIAQPNGLELVINQHWYQSRVRIAATEKLQDTLFVTPQQPEGEIFFGMTSYNMHLPGKPFYIENALELLDAPGEWFLDADAQWLYYKPLPGTDPATSTIVAPAVETLVSIKGSGNRPITNLQFKNIAFAYSTWLMPDRRGSIATQAAQQRKFEDSSGRGLMEVAFADGLLIEQCSITGAGAHGLVLAKGVRNAVITRNHFNQISANAIVIDTDKKAQQADSVHCTRNSITYNLIENIGIHYTNGMGILASNVSKHLIAHNEIRYGRYSGMQIGNHYGDNLSRLRDNRIEHNNIHHVMLLHDDGGAIYTLSNQPGTKILKNWIHDYNKCQWADSYPVNGIFLDNNSSYILVADNVFTDLKDVDRLKENIGTTIHDNEFRNNASRDPDIIKAAGL